jgi:2-keto-4-pentenoate hydratase/2-oxohepta-3-ene-1,7-dioic acid hydratase in catechol pathway
VTYESSGAFRAGVVVNGSVVDAAAAARDAGFAREDHGWVSNRRILSLDNRTLRELGEAAERLAKQDGGFTPSLEDVRLEPPVPDPEKIICLGLNYREHAAEARLDAPEVPMLFGKFRNSLIGQGKPVVLPQGSQKVDYEGELAVVIGRRCKQVSAEEALDYVGGYMPLNDVSARDLQKQTSQWMAGKALDTFAPCGPELVLVDEVDDVQNLAIKTRVNGETVQDANTSMMIFPVRETIAFISTLMTLEPGDIIATGTPSGVGQSRVPPLFLKAGDVVEVEIEGLGLLRNPVVGSASVPQKGAERAAIGKNTLG